MLHGIVNLIKLSLSFKISTVIISLVRARVKYASSPSFMRHLKMSVFKFVLASGVRAFGVNSPVCEEEEEKDKK